MFVARAAIAVGVALAGVVSCGAGVALGRIPTSPIASTSSPGTEAVAGSDSASPAVSAPPRKKSKPPGELIDKNADPDTVISRIENGVTVESRLSTNNPVFFITIDDGWEQQESAADYVTETELPVTVFLTDAAVSENWAFFKKMGAFDAVQNHSMTHKAMSKASTNLDYEICTTQKRYEEKYGVRPWILRPPYGAGFMPENDSAQLIEKTAASCGIKHIALWNVTVSKDGVIQFASEPYQAGDIVLLHFEGDLKANLQKVVKQYAAKGLTPASLSKYLPEDGVAPVPGLPR